MKEYIAKEDMTITLNHNGEIYRIEVPLSKMDGLKTVTKAEITRELRDEIFRAIDTSYNDLMAELNRIYRKHIGMEGK